MKDLPIIILAIILGIALIYHVLTRSEPVPELVPEPTVHLYDTTSAAPSLGPIPEPVQHDPVQSYSLSGISAPKWVDNLPRSEKAKVSNPLGDKQFINQLGNVQELCYQGVVYIMSHSHQRGYLSPKIDKRDRLPMTCD